MEIWFRFVEPFKSYHLNFLGGGHKPPVRGVTCDLRYPLSNLAEVFQSKVMCEIWFGLVEPFKSYRVHKHFSGGGKKSHWGGGVTFLNSDVLFQSKVMCENLVWIG